MHKQIFVNLAVADMAKSKAFFTSLGYSFDPDFTGDQGASLVLGDNLYAMLMVRVRVARVVQAMMKTSKFDIAALQRAYDGA